jgi:hypothetical protein
MGAPCVIKRHGPSVGCAAPPVAVYGGSTPRPPPNVRQRSDAAPLMSGDDTLLPNLSYQSVDVAP